MLHGERFNTYTHLLGFALSMLGLVLVVAKTIPGGDPGKIAGGLVFALSSVVLYAASTLFHCMRGRAKRWWQRADHCAIYLLIAGSYTPFALALAEGIWCWAPLVAVWSVSILGAVREIKSHPSAPPLGLYIGLGWLMVAAATPWVARMQAGGLFWLLIGAASYTAGTVFYINRSGYRHAHGVWHLFVLAGTTSHFVAVAGYVL